MTYITIFFVISCLGSLLVGDLGFSDLHSMYLNQSDVFKQILRIRLDRLLAAFLVGANLSTSGLLLQSFFRNPLAESYTTGISGIIAFSISLFAFLQLESSQSLFLTSFFCSFLITSMFYWFLVSKSKHGFESHKWVLIGICISLFGSSLSIVLNSFLHPYKLQEVYQFLIGDLGSHRDSLAIYLIVPSLISIFYLFNKSTFIDSLQVDPSSLMQKLQNKNSRLFVLVIVIFLATAAICVGGVVSFVGLMGPHITRSLLKKGRNSQLILPSVMVGTTIVLVSDCTARLLPIEQEIATGSIIALVGFPYLLLLVWNNGEVT